MSKYRHRQPTDEERSDAVLSASPYWQSLSKEVTSSALFVDATAILDYHDHKSKYRDKAREFLDREAAMYRYITSTYVVAEVVRKLIHPNVNNDFRGPNGSLLPPIELAIFLTHEWLDSVKIRPICVPIEVFELAKKNLERNKSKAELKGWTLTDAISYEIVKGLEHKQIVSSDGAFRVLGLTLLPY
jgi:predicted nucleic acid-binding protein